MTAEFLSNISQASIGTSISILLILFMRKWLRKTFGARIAYLFWLIVPLAMIASILPAEYVTVSNDFYYTKNINAAQSLNALPKSLNGVISPAHQAVDGFSIDQETVLIFWVLGVVVSFGILILRQYLFLMRQKLLKRARRIQSVEGNTFGPAVIGVLKPRVILPKDFVNRYNKLERSLIIAHEKAHIRGGDLQVNAFVQVIKCLNWFNPLVYYGQTIFRIDQELACDERVMAVHSQHRRAYAETLLKSQLLIEEAPIGCSWLPKHIHPLRSRVESLSGPAISAKRRVLGVMLSLAMMSVTSVSAWAILSTHTLYIEQDTDGVKASVPDEGNSVSDVDTASDAKGYALAYAVSEGRRSYARKLVRDGADVNYYLRGDGTPLILSARFGDSGLVNLLLEAGADPNKPASGDGSPLIVAARHGHETIVKMLLDAGSDANGFVLGDETPLIGAAANGNITIARLLIDAGADVSLKVETGNHGEGRSKYRSPLGQALLYGNNRMASLLRRRGATEPSQKED